jgi:hypothetical protein
MKELTRREFLELAARQSLTASIAASALLQSSCLRSPESPSALGLDGSATETLIAVIDEIIPAGDGMPAASEVGTLPYFELIAASEAALPETVQASLRTADTMSQERFGSPFTSVSRERRVEILSAFEKGDAVLFKKLRDYVYEASYLQPRVWTLIGYDPYPTNAAGPQMEPFDEALLNRVRGMSPLFKEV